jgi:hypothetical protein
MDNLIAVLRGIPQQTQKKQPEPPPTFRDAIEIFLNNTNKTKKKK